MVKNFGGSLVSSFCQPLRNIYVYIISKSLNVVFIVVMYLLSHINVVIQST